MSQRACSSQLWFPCGSPSTATTAAALCLLIQHARVTTSAGSQRRIYRSLHCSSQQTGANPRPLHECHDNRLLASNHHAVPKFVSRGEVCPMRVQKLHWYLWGRTVLSAIVSVAYLALQTCFRCTISTCSWVVHNRGCKRSILFGWW